MEQHDSPSTYNHNHRPGHDNRTQEDSRSNLADEDSHWRLEEDIGNEEHQDNDGLDQNAAVSEGASVEYAKMDDTHIAIANAQLQLLL